MSKGILRVELTRRDFGYKELAEKLAAIEIEDNERNLGNKIARGAFTAVFFVQRLVAIGVERIQITD